MIPNCNLISSMGVQFLVFKGDDLISNALRRGGYETEIYELAKRILSRHEEGNVIDMGANLGSFSVPLAKVFPKIKFHAFEPQRIISYQLCANAIINGLENIYTYELALSDNENNVRVSIPDYAQEKNIGAFSIDQMTRKNDYEVSTEVNISDDIDVVSLDWLNFKDIKLIKADVEGHELNALIGAEKTLKRCSYPPIIFEAWTWKPWFEKKRQDLMDYLKSLGYLITPLGENNLAQHPAHGEIIKVEVVQ